MCVILCKIDDPSIVYHIPGWDVYITKNDTLKRPHIPIPPPHKNLSNIKHKYVIMCKIEDTSIEYHIPGWDAYLTKNDTLNSSKTSPKPYPSFPTYCFKQKP